MACARTLTYMAFPIWRQDHPGDDIGAGGREEGDTTLSVAQSCALDAACQGFSSRSAMKYRALPAAQAEDTGTCLYVKQPGDERGAWKATRAVSVLR